MGVVRSYSLDGSRAYIGGSDEGFTFTFTFTSVAYDLNFLYQYISFSDILAKIPITTWVMRAGQRSRKGL